jgi:hypothetical protein
LSVFCASSCGNLMPRGGGGMLKARKGVGGWVREQALRSKGEGRLGYRTQGREDQERGETTFGI